MKTFACVIAAIFVAGCSHRDVLSTGIQGSPTDCILTAGFRVNPVSNTAHVGDTVKYTVDVLSSAGCSNITSSEAAAVAWRSSDTLVARVDAITGSTRALATGLVTITASSKQDSNVKSAGVLQIVP
jgi:uncharacterized protein YjdB